MCHGDCRIICHHEVGALPPNQHAQPRLQKLARLDACLACELRVVDKDAQRIVWAALGEHGAESGIEVASIAARLHQASTPRRVCEAQPALVGRAARLKLARRLKVAHDRLAEADSVAHHRPVRILLGRLDDACVAVGANDDKRRHRCEAAQCRGRSLGGLACYAGPYAGLKRGPVMQRKRACRMRRQPEHHLRGLNRDGATAAERVDEHARRRPR